MKIKVIQADTRPLKIYLESRNLSYGPSNQMDLGLIASLNKNVLIQPNDSISNARILNLLKCKIIGAQYENVIGNPDDWEPKGEKGVCWIKIKSLIEQIKNMSNKDIDVFCFIDSDAWIRDENAFVQFCSDFLKTDFFVAAPRDIELPEYSFFNSGFIAVKNNKKGLEILETIFSHPEYREFEKKNWWEQSELSIYHNNHPGEVMVLPLNDFNTPCGRIVRHCWIKHILEPLVMEEIIATMTRLATSFTSDSKYILGNQVFLSPSS